MTDPVAELPLSRKILFSLLPLCLLLLLAEAGLRLAGWEDAGVETMEFTFPLDDWRSRDEVRFLERDPVVFWKPRPNAVGHNSRGLYGPEFAVPKPAGLYRVVALGDSCTHFGPRPYPERWGEFLKRRAPGRFEVLNGAVLGWTSYQGLRRLRTEVPEWQPDLVTVYFGWNDHYLARGRPDREQPEIAPWRFQLGRVLGRLRFYQFLSSLARPPAAAARTRYRVEPEDYAENLRAMREVGDRLEAEVWFLTAPHALDRGVPRFLVESGEVADPGKLVDLHREYNEIVRRTGRELGVRVVDLEREIDRMDKSILFEDDHIHLSDQGRTLVAAILYAVMLDHGYLPPEANPPVDTAPDPTLQGIPRLRWAGAE